MDFYKCVDRHMRLRMEEAERLKREMSAMPDGRLLCWKNGNNCSWHVKRDDGKTTYLPKSERETSRLLAHKAICQAQLEKAKKDIKACKRYLATGTGIGEDAFRDINPEIISLALEGKAALGDKAEMWKKAPYIKSDRYQEKLNIRTASGLMVRSKSEAIIADQLDLLNIPYRYEQVHSIGRVRISPDFTAYSVKKDIEILIEHCGMMGSPDYVSNYISKTKIYLENGYIPDKNLLYFYESAGSPLDAQLVRNKLELIFY